MFQTSLADLTGILADFGVHSAAAAFSELQRYHYENDDPASREVRLIVKVAPDSGEPLVVRFKNESDVTRELIEAQSRFAALLRENGVETPRIYRTDGGFARWYTLGGYDVIVTIEQFVEGELTVVDEAVAEETGALLAETHDISERADFHVQNPVLFDPLSDNDLFDRSVFMENIERLRAVDASLCAEIERLSQICLAEIAPLEDEGRFAVQGDISDCNLYRAKSGRLGLFDFNRAGDNVLFFDAAMQAVFEARLMDYPEAWQGGSERRVLPAFLRGYHRVRPFSTRQIRAWPFLYALVSAFWSLDMKWNEDSLRAALESSDIPAQRRWLEAIRARLDDQPAMPL